MRSSLFKNQHGFTLIELIVVIAILGILAAILVPNIMNYSVEARDNSSQFECVELYSAASRIQSSIVMGLLEDNTLSSALISEGFIVPSSNILVCSPTTENNDGFYVCLVSGQVKNAYKVANEKVYVAISENSLQSVDTAEPSVEVLPTDPDFDPYPSMYTGDPTLANWVLSIYSNKAMPIATKEAIVRGNLGATVETRYNDNSPYAATSHRCIIYGVGGAEGYTKVVIIKDDVVSISNN